MTQEAGGAPAVLGVDAGGSKCAAVRVDRHGNEVAHGSGGPANPNTVGVAAAAEAILGACRGALGSAAFERIAVLGVGVAGAGSPAVREALVYALSRHAPRAHVWIGTDLEAALSGAFEGQSGLIVVAGTGSGVFARRGDGSEVRCGGWGPRLGDEGSGYWFVRETLRGALRAWEMGDEVGELGAHLLRELGASSPEELPAHFHRLADRPPEVAARARRLLDEFAGHPIVQRTAEECGRALAELCLRGARAAALEHPRIAGIGGLLQDASLVRSALQRHLKKAVEGAQWVDAVRSPAWGAAARALEERARTKGRR